MVVVNPHLPFSPGDHRITPPTRMLPGLLNGERPAYLDEQGIDRAVRVGSRWSRAMLNLLQGVFLLTAVNSVAAQFEFEVLERPANSFVTDVKAINASGDVLGKVSDGSRGTAVLWSGTHIVRTLRAGDVLNDHGMVAGSMYAGQISIEIPKYSAVIYSNDVSHTVPEFGSGSMFALGINNKGEVVGGGDGSNGRDPFLWRNGQRFDLNDLVDLDVDLEFARVITETGVIYATSYLYGSGAALYKLTPTDAGRYAAVELFRTNRVLHFSVNSSGYVADGGSLWADGNMVSLGDFGTDRVYAQSVNSSKEVVGYAQPKDDPSYHGFLWNGKMLDLNDVVEAPGWLIHTASSINEYGQIAAMGWNGHFHAAMRLTPKPQAKMAISRTGWPVASVRPGSRRPVVFMASSNLVEWSRLARHERPEPEISLPLPAGASATFFRVVRE